MNTEMVASCIQGSPQTQGDEPIDEGLEDAIAEVWQEVFHLENIDHNANFFELGGNSLLGMDITELLAMRLGIEVPVLTIFQHPSIREMTSVIITDQ
jgi:Phosphopantetheine attachment site